MTEAEQLLADVKLHLNITWTDPDTDRKVQMYIDSSKAYINDKLGTAADYSAARFPRDLLMDRCRYLWSDAVEVFENNFLPLILAMQNNRKVAVFDGDQEAE